MENNIIEHATGTIIMNGGNPFEGCPESWEEARSIQEKFNEGKEYGEPKWEFDCGFKLDFDGPLVRVSSRFYPPKTHYGSTWDGTVTIFILDKEVEEKKFDCPTLDELKTQVEEYVKSFAAKLETALTLNN